MAITYNPNANAQTALVQNVTTKTLTIPSVTAGNTLFLAIAWEDPVNTTGLSFAASNVSDTNGSGWVQDITGVTAGTFGTAVSIFRLNNAAAGSHAVTINTTGRGFNSNQMAGGAALWETTPVSLDKTTAQVNATSSPATTNSTGVLSSATEIAFSLFGLDASTVAALTSPGAPWTTIYNQSTQVVYNSFSYQIVAATTALTASATTTATSPDIAAVIVTYSDASGIATPPARPMIEPTIRRTIPAQPDLPKNIAVRLQSARPAGKLIEPPIRLTRPPVPDVFPNVAIRAPAEAPKRQPGLTDAPVWRPKFQAPDLPPNIAATGSAPVALIRQLVEVPPKSRPWTQPELSPNIAIGFPQTYVTSPPLYVNKAGKVPSQPDLFPNVAVQTTVTYVLPPPVEPTLWRARPQVDVLPNIAAGFPQTYVTREPLFVTGPGKRWTQPDLPPNVAATPQMTTVAGVYVDPPTRKTPVQIDLFPNLAARGAAPYQPRPSVDIAPVRKAWAQPEVWPNVAANAPVAVVVGPGVLTVNAPWKRWTQVDLTPNLAVILPPPGNLTDFDQLPGKPWTAFDLFPNLAVTAAQAQYVVRPPTYVTKPGKPWTQVDPLPNPALIPTNAVAVTVPTTPTYVNRPGKPWAQVDQLPNVAALSPPVTGILTDFDQLPGKPWVQIDLFPNLAATATQAITVPRAPVQVTAPWKRFTQTEQFPNVALFQTFQLAFVLPQQDARTTVPRFWQGDVLPNIAVEFNNVIPPYVPSTGNNGGGGGGGWGTFKFSNDGRVEPKKQKRKRIKRDTASQTVAPAIQSPPVRGDDDDEEAIWLLMQ